MNASLPELEQLRHDEYNLDLEEQKRMQAEQDKQIQEVSVLVKSMTHLFCGVRERRNECNRFYWHKKFSVKQLCKSSLLSPRAGLLLSFSELS